MNSHMKQHACILWEFSAQFEKKWKNEKAMSAQSQKICKNFYWHVISSLVLVGWPQKTHWNFQARNRAPVSQYCIFTSRILKKWLNDDKFLKKGIDKIIFKSFIDTAQIELTGLGFFIDKTQRTLQFCFDHQNFNDVSMWAPYPISHVNKSIDSLQQATVTLMIDANSYNWQMKTDIVIGSKRKLLGITTVIFQFIHENFRIHNAT